jgi:alkaline phosphatase D
MARFNRRDFLKTTGTFIASAALLGKTSACGDDDGGGTEPAGTYTFPQGVASGDPRTTSVVLWTRVVRTAAATGPIDLRVEVATDAGFASVVVNMMVQATEASDNTVRVLVTGLSAATAYHYRFTAGSDSIAGRTRSAPARDADVPVHLAWVSCQDYEAGTYLAYRQLLADDDARPEAEKIQFVVHMGDFIYETRGQEFSRALDENFQPITVMNADGSQRVMPPYPSNAGATSAQTLADYRHIYRTYLSDPDLRAARARWPFIHTWDDHEFSNDCWQSQANYEEQATLDEGRQTRKYAGNQAWFEYVPSQLTGAEGVTGVPNQAKDFTPTTVVDAMFTAPNADNFTPEPNNVAAVGSLTLYRSHRFGRHVELVVTDDRSYRSDHAIPEDLSSTQPGVFFDPRNALPLQMVNIFDAGKTANGGNPPAEVGGFPNSRRESPAGTMLGKPQREWFKESMKRSDATWKLWASPVPIMRMRIQKEGLELLGTDRVMSGDAWDGWPTERNELLTYFRTENIKNVVAIAGDLHAHYAGVLMDNYDAASPSPVGVELVAAGVSSNSELSFFESATRGLGEPVHQIIVFDASSTGGSPQTENLNVALLKGTRAAVTFAQSKNLTTALAVADPNANAHIKYCDTNAQGYGIMSVTATGVTATLVTINRPISPTATGIKRTAKFTIPKDNPAGMTGPEFTGTKPVPFT